MLKNIVIDLQRIFSIFLGKGRINISRSLIRILPDYSDLVHINLLLDCFAKPRDDMLLFWILTFVIGNFIR